MLNKRYRFHSRGGVNYVRKNGRMIRAKKIALTFCPNSRGFTRVTVVVSKKIDKRAVVRNRIRRRIYEAIRVNLKLVPKRVDYIFSVRSRKVLTMEFSELERILGGLVAESQEKGAGGKIIVKK